MSPFLFRSCPLLLGNVWQESHEPCTLHCDCELALILGRNASSLSAQDASMWIQELTEDLRVLIINEFDIMLTKITLFFHNNDLVLINFTL